VAFQRRKGVPQRPAMADLDDLLVKTSRTFALAIPLLDEPTRRAVSVAYLLFRIADTFEDAFRWPRAERIAALNDFCTLLDDRARAAALSRGWVEKKPVDHAGYLELLALVPEVLSELDTMAPGAREILKAHTRRTSEGMATIVARGDAAGNLQLRSLQDLKDYCYIVAGIVGELLTQVFLHDAPQLEGQRATLERHMAAFGEGLQLVNILKDSGDDAKEGRVYLPPGVPRADIIALAREDLDRASTYVAALQEGQAPRGYLAFTALPVMLARAALKALEEQGPGAKVPRTEVARLMGVLDTTLASGQSLEQATA
jgi:farnesyl-diphosphate farnesyltransferase